MGAIASPNSMCSTLPPIESLICCDTHTAMYFSLIRGLAVVCNLFNKPDVIVYLPHPGLQDNIGVNQSRWCPHVVGFLRRLTWRVYKLPQTRVDNSSKTFIRSQLSTISILPISFSSPQALSASTGWLMLFRFGKVLLNKVLGGPYRKTELTQRPPAGQTRSKTASRPLGLRISTRFLPRLPNLENVQ